MDNEAKWSEIYKELSNRSETDALKPGHLVRHSLSAFLLGKDAESQLLLEKAHQKYLNLDQCEESVRCAFWLAMIYQDAREQARSNGWLARGERILEEKIPHECAEKGLFLIPRALGSFYSGRYDQAGYLFEQAVRIGERFQDPDLISLGRLGKSQTLIQNGSLEEGFKLLDETMIITGTEEIFPVGKGIIYCAGIETCRKVWDLGRAKEWTLALERWCDSQSDMVPFRGQCQVSKAEISQFHGDWFSALQEASDACEILTKPPGRSAAGLAYYRKAELLRLTGNEMEADEAYRNASKWGRIAHPGLALLRLHQGQHKAAEVSIKNTLQETSDVPKRLEILPAYVQIMIAGDEIDQAKEALSEYKIIAEAYESPYLLSMYAYCKSIVSIAENQFSTALDHLSQALETWNSMNLPYESALTRELKAIAYHHEGDVVNAETEMSIARWLYEQLGAKPDLERIKRLIPDDSDIDTYGLTLREMQVLNQVASGLTNKSIGGQLYISERTVDRHVSNIFNKLGVSSRVEATTFAIHHNLLDPAK